MPNEDAASLQIRCSGTGEVRQVKQLKSGKASLPRGWKRLGGEFYSAEAWHSRFRLRTIQVPVAGVECPVNSPEASRAAWAQLRAALQVSWRQATQVSNWIMTELAKQDSAPLIEADAGPRLPPMPSLGPLQKQLYRDGRDKWPELDSQSFGSIRQQVVAKYLQLRFELRCRSSISLPTYRYPIPLPIPSKDAVVLERNGQLLLRVRISGTRFLLRLRGGREFRRAISTLQKVRAGELLSGEVKLLERNVGGAHYARDRDGSTGMHSRLMVSMAVWTPRQSPVQGHRKCIVQSTSTRLWSVHVDGREEDPWHLNEDQIRRWALAHRSQLQRLREDMKFERRRDRTDDLAQRRKKLRVKYQNRMNDACHKVSTMLVGFCRRRGVVEVEYDDQNKNWLRDFPWYKLRQYCADKCTDAGISFHARIVNEGKLQSEARQPGENGDQPADN